MTTPDAESGRTPKGAQAANESLRNRPMERVLGALLRWGVSIAAAVAVVGAVMSLTRNGGDAITFGTFAGEPAALRSIAGILTGVAARDPRSVMQLGIVLLIATPIARVAVAFVLFVRRKDVAYILLTAIVLVVLQVSLFSNRA